MPDRLSDAARCRDDATARLCERTDTAGDVREADFERGWSEFARGSHSRVLSPRWARERQLRLIGDGDASSARGTQTAALAEMRSVLCGA